MKHLTRKLASIKYYYWVLLPVALLMFPNRGITHDTRLYVFDILNIVHDGIFANDLVALAGTQNEYTLFAHLAAPAYQIMSPWAATAVVFALGQLVWFSGAIALVAKFTEDAEVAFYGLLTAVLLPTAYFGFSVLSYGEPFATPRLFVEGLTFWALWCFFNRAHVAAGGLALAAMSLHPIMGLITAALIVAILLQEGRRWWWIFGAGSAAVLAAAILSGVVPLERLTATLTGDWFEAVAVRARYLFVSEWLARDWSRIGISVSLAAPLIALYTGWQRRLIVAALIVGAAGLVVSFIGTDLLHNVLLSQLQTSRAIWFAYWLGNVGMGVVVANMYRRSEADGDSFFFLYLLAWTIGHIFWPLSGLAIGIVAAALAYLRFAGKIAGIPSLLRRLIYVTSIILFFFLFFFRIKFWLLSFNRDAITASDSAFAALAGIPGFTHMELIFVVLVIFAVVRLKLRVPAAVTVSLLIVLAAWSVIAWDRRSAEERGLEGDYLARALVQRIPEGAQVYWEGSAVGPWFLLGRPSYFASIQGAGSVFSEPLAAEFLKRGRIAKALDGVDYVDIWHPFETLDELRTRVRVLKQLTRRDLADACRNAPELDYMVLTRAVDSASIAVWYPRTAADVAAAPASSPDLVPTMAYFLYRCADLR